jgi:prepilin-type N-terminal cleavage/methylation domain-containing protein
MAFKAKNAFTLAELLVVIGVLAVIASFTIPKILISTQKSIVSKQFKDTFITFDGLLYQAWQTGDVYRDFGAYVLNQVNSIKTCSGGSPGCAPLTAEYTGRAYITFANGISVLNLPHPNGITPGSAWAASIDVNGDAGPNARGEDIISVLYWVPRLNGGLTDTGSKYPYMEVRCWTPEETEMYYKYFSDLNIAMFGCW